MKGNYLFSKYILFILGIISLMSERILKKIVLNTKTFSNEGI